MSVIVKSNGGATSVLDDSLGVIFNAVDTSGYPTDVKIRGSVPQNMFKGNTNSIFSNLINLEVVGDSIGWEAFSGRFVSIDDAGKFKLKVTEIAYRAFYQLALGSEKAVKIWISKDCTTIGQQAFYDSYSGIKIYFEANSAPSSVGTEWASVTPTYGVSEAEFDAL